MLLHINTKLFVHIQRDDSSNSNGSLQINLTKELNQSCIFKIFPSSQARKIGNKICDSDTIYIKESYEDQYFWNSNGKQRVGYSINGSDDPATYQIKIYSSQLEQEEESKINASSKYLKAGDIIYIKNYKTDSVLTVSCQSISENTVSLSCRIKMDTSGEQGLHQQD